MAAETYEKLSMVGKVAVVTGGTQGLGEATAHLFAARGAAGIVICGRNAQNGARVKSSLEKNGTRTVYVKADLANVEDCRKVIAETDKAFGQVDVLVNAAAITDRGTIWDTEPKLFDAMFAVNVRAPAMADSRSSPPIAPPRERSSPSPRMSPSASCAMASALTVCVSAGPTRRARTGS
jgi:NAD(P)-dependent dehydrogenase (short-subunit alcohol dehydrogenase family)